MSFVRTKAIPLVRCISMILSLGLSHSSDFLTTTANPFFLSQSAANVDGFTIQGPQAASEGIPWCNPELFAKPIDGSMIAPPEEKDFPPKPVCKIRTVGRTLPVEEIQALRKEMLRRYPQLKDLSQVGETATTQSQ